MKTTQSPMVKNPETYFHRLTPKRDPLLIELEADAQKREIPIIGPVVGELLFILAKAIRAQSIIELGAATGYSGIYLARALAANQGRLTTIEWNPDLAGEARRNFEKVGLVDRIDIHIGDAQQTLTKLDARFDMAFLDIDKEFYRPVIEVLHPKMAKGGLLVADNTAFEDADEFNQTLFNSADWQGINLYAFLPGHSPVHDGLCLALAQ